LGRRGISKKMSLNRKSVREVMERIQESLGAIPRNLSGKAVRIEVLRSRKTNIFFVDGEPLFVEKEDKILPSLLNEEVLSRLPSAVVDQGAVPFVCNGADVMAPGVRRVEGGFSQGHLVVVREERFHKMLAVGYALVGSEEIEEQRRGKVIRNLHFIGDDAWHECTQLAGSKR